MALEVGQMVLASTLMSWCLPTTLLHRGHDGENHEARGTTYVPLGLTSKAASFSPVGG